jgi:hypothetical protein
MIWEDHESKRSATAGGGELSFRFILHNSSFILAVQRLPRLAQAMHGSSLHHAVRRFGFFSGYLHQDLRLRLRER